MDNDHFGEGLQQSQWVFSWRLSNPLLFCFLCQEIDSIYYWSRIWIVINCNGIVFPLAFTFFKRNFTPVLFSFSSFFFFFFLKITLMLLPHGLFWACVTIRVQCTVMEKHFQTPLRFHTLSNLSSCTWHECVARGNILLKLSVLP